MPQLLVEDRAETYSFALLARSLAAQGLSFRFRAHGRSMMPAILDGEVLHVEPVRQSKLKRGDIVLFQKEDGLKAHRILRKKGEHFITRGDAGMHTDGEVHSQQILGRVTAKECSQTGKLVTLADNQARMRFRLWQLRTLAAQLCKSALIAHLTLIGLFLLLASSAVAQVVVDSASSGSVSNTGSGAFTMSVSHTTGSGANRLMVVGISLNNNGNAGTTITRVCNGGTGAAGCPGGQILTRALQAEASNVRVEMWNVLSPTASTTANVVITVNKVGSNRIGVVAGVITFTGVDQTAPIHLTNSASGTSTTATATVTAGNSDMVLDTVAVTNNITITTPSPQISRWNLVSGTIGGNAGGAGSTCTGSSCSGTVPIVSMTENLSTSTAWTIGVMSIRALQADMSITKVGSPEPVLQNATLTYTLTVKNNGLQNAPGVLVVDTLPAQVSYVSSSWVNGSNSGTCSQASGTVSCAIGAMANGATATVTIITTAITPSSAVNTAVVTPILATDADLSNNTATFTSTIEYPNAVGLNSLTAEQGSSGALLSWNTGGELHNLGFNVYRDVNGQKVKLNSSLIAGSALLMRDTVSQHAAKTYRWVDRSPATGALYWVEDVDLNGTRTLHGPISGDVASATSTLMPRSPMVQDLASASPAIAHSEVAMSAGASPLARVREALSRPESRLSNIETGFKLAASPAVKIFVDHEGWYRVSQPQLVAAGLSSKVEPRFLHLYAEGVERPIRITGGERFGPQSAIEFYGTAIDTPYSGQRVYWLTEGHGPGLRIPGSPASGSAGAQALSFMQTLELKPRTTYFGTLLRENTDEFFGPLVSSVPESETINITNLAPGDAGMSVALQGITDGQQHTVTVMLNGSTLGDLNFANQSEGREEFAIPSGILTNGVNTITLLAQQGDNDYSLVDTIDLSFPHSFTAESDQLKFTANAGESVTIAGFVQRPSRLIDITNPLRPFPLQHEVTVQNGGYTLSAMIPWTTAGPHTLLALSPAQLGTPVALLRHHPTQLHSAQQGSEYLVLTTPQFADRAQPIAELHKSEGKTVAVINVDNVYDEFNFGERTPFAIRSFLKAATEAWKNKPRYLLLVGDASVDPRNYLGLGSFDFVPTKLVATAELMTASDDWFSDFENTGTAKIATGRLPARTADDARMMVSKVVSYATGKSSTWNTQAMMVADSDDPTLSFTQQAQSVQQLLPSSITATDVFAGVLGTSTARQNLLDGINNGQLLVNYDGHGSVEVWSGGGLFNSTLASSLTNGNKLPLFVIMNCLNGFFHDVYTQSMAESLMLAPNGGAVAVWASSGLTAPGPQFAMNKTLAQTLFSGPEITLGNAVLAAKSSISDQDVRKTFILFGDPLMHLQLPAMVPETTVSKPGDGTAPTQGSESKRMPALNVGGKPKLDPND
jgi:uncharacterized repeat protein (TIGR01451 family)